MAAMSFQRGGIGSERNTSIPGTPPRTPRSTPHRSVFVTALAWVVMVLSGLLTPISVISLMMILVGSYGTATWDPVGFFSVVVAPPATFVAGFGLLLRWRWARFYMLALLAILIIVNVSQLSQAGVTTTTYTSASGQRTTKDVWGGPNYYSMPIIVVCAVAMLGLLRPAVAREFREARESNQSSKHRADAENSRGMQTSEPLPDAPLDSEWRVGHQGRDRMYYEERHHGDWERIEIEGEMLMGTAHHVIYFASPERWQSYPDWARHRRAEIIDRVKSAFRPPDYEYYGDSMAGSSIPARQTAFASPRLNKPTATAKQYRALLLVIVLLLGIAGGMGWFVKKGLDNGTTFFPSKRPSLQRPISRQQEPATFWLAIGFYSAIGLGTGGLALWFVREARRLSVEKG
jgi:hypothetical protein